MPLLIRNPKRDNNALLGRAGWYPYYAGYSPAFARELLHSAKLKRGTVVLDPWNGSGTTTVAAHELGLRAVGFDLNPVMVTVARARLLPHTESPSAITLANEVCQQVAKQRTTSQSDDALRTWFDPDTSAQLRAIERTIFRLLVSTDPSGSLAEATFSETTSCLASFLYLGLFRTARFLLDAFTTSNPTWVKRIGADRPAARAGPEQLRFLFLGQIAAMAAVDLPRLNEQAERPSKVRVAAANSTKLPLAANSVDFTLTSPPYCTRIDYAVATTPELAVIGFRPDVEAEALRRELLGTSTVPTSVPNMSEDWGPSCGTFLNAVRSHASKASATYYFKSHVQYYAGIFESLRELARVSKSYSSAVIVSQDSYYKEVHNDVSGIICEMMEHLGFALTQRSDFCSVRNMANIHPGVKRYRTTAKATESVLCFRKEQ